MGPGLHVLMQYRLALCH